MNGILTILLLCLCLLFSCQMQDRSVENGSEDRPLVKDASWKSKPDFRNLVFDGKKGGCGSLDLGIYVFRGSADNTKAIFAKIDYKNLPKQSDGLYRIERFSEIDVFVEDHGSETYLEKEGFCTDAPFGSDTKPARIEVLKGRIKIRANEREASIVLTELELKSSRNGSEKIPDVEIQNIEIGWLPG